MGTEGGCLRASKGASCLVPGIRGRPQLGTMPKGPFLLGPGGSPRGPDVTGSGHTGAKLLLSPCIFSLISSPTPWCQL